MRKQRKDWEWFHEHGLGEDRLVQLEGMHQSESMELQCRQQREQGELMSLVFDCMSMAATATRAAAAVESSSAQTTEQYPEPSARGSSRTIETAEIIPKTTTAADDSNRSGNSDPSSVAKDASPPPLADRISTDRRKADEIKAVMRNRNLSREERQRKLAEIKERYASADDGGGAMVGRDREGGKDRGGKTGEKSISERRRVELQAVMKDRSLGREEKQEKMSEIKNRYAAMVKREKKRQEGQGSNIDITKTQVVESREKIAANAKEEEEDEKQERAREEFARPMDRDIYHASEPINDGSSRGSTRSDSSKALSNSNRSGPESDLDHNERGQKEGGNLAEESENEGKPEPPPPSPENEEKRERVANRWNRAAVKAATSNAIIAGTQARRDSLHSSGVASSVDLVFDGKESGTSGALGGGLPPPIPGGIKIDDTPGSNNTSLSTLPKDPLEDAPTDRTPIKKLVKKLDEDYPSLVVLKLDGRKKIKEEDWEKLFESLEENSTLTHLSISRCEIKDDMAVALVLALVENETLVALRLNNNKGLTDDTAKGFIKVLKQSNKSLKKLELTRTNVTKKSMVELNKILEERDDQKKTAKMQEERQKKIQALLSFSAGDKVAEDVSVKMEVSTAVDDDNDADVSRRSDMMSVGSGTSSRMEAASKTSSKRRTANRSGSAVRSSKRSGSNPRASSVRASGGRGKVRGRGAGGAPGTRGGRGGNRQSTARASRTAQAMAQLGGDITNVGADATKLKEQRKMRGECETCGQKCFQKTMFKTTPMTLPNKVYEGRCLKCNPM